jgi:O-antigen ligase
MIGKPVWNFALLIVAILFEQRLVILPELSLIKAMTITTFLAFAIHRRDFIHFIVDRLVTNRFFILWVLIFIVSSIFAEDNSSIISELLGFIQWLLVLIFVWYVYEKETHAVDSVEKWALLLGVCVLFLIIFVQGLSSLNRSLILHFFLNPNHIAFFFIGLVVLSYYRWIKTKEKKYLILLCVFIASIILTGNRSIPLGFIIFLFVYFILISRVRRIYIFVSTALLVIIFLILPFKQDSMFFNVRTRITYSFKQAYELLRYNKISITPREEYYHTDIYRSSRIDKDVRLIQYREALALFKRNPIFGAGPGNNILSVRMERIIGRIKGIHSNLIEITIFYGLIGLVFSLYLFFFLMKFGYHHKSTIEGKLLMLLVVIFFVDGLFHTNYKDSVFVLYMTMLGCKVRVVSGEEQLEFGRSLMSENENLSESKL